MIGLKKTKWYSGKHRQRAQRALARQLEYQRQKAAEIAGNEKAVILNMMKRTARVRQKLCEIYPFEITAKVLEVGSGAHGLIFNFGNKFCVGVDPLAHHYQRLFPLWQKNVPNITAIGEQLPFADSSFDLVLSDNVIDHAENPVIIIHELVRVLKPGGMLYLTVNVHHQLYSFASDLHGLWNAIGISFELSPFADHTFHYTVSDIKRILNSLPVNVLKEERCPPNLADKTLIFQSVTTSERLKRIFFKNMLFEIVAIKR